MGKASRDKGARLEREVCSLFHKIMNWPARRELSQYQESTGRDIAGTSPFVIQVKGGKNPNIYTAIKEAKKAVGDTYIWPVAFTKKDGGEWLVTMDKEVFFNLLFCIFGTDPDDPVDTRLDEEGEDPYPPHGV